MKLPTSGTSKILAASLLFALLVATLANYWLASSQNILVHNTEWASGKPEMQYLLNGSETYTFTRPALAMNVLNLHPWFGRQEVYSKKQGVLTQFSFEFRISYNVYIDVELSRSAEGVQGVRIYNSPFKHSFLYVANRDGAFLEKRDLGNISIHPFLVWNSVAINYIPSTSKLEVRVNENTAFNGNFSLRSGSIGFRGGNYRAQIDNVKASFDNGQQIRDDFKFQLPRGVWWKHFFLALVSAGLLIALSVAFGRRRGAVRFLGYVFTLIAIVFLFDIVNWSRRSLAFYDDILLELSTPVSYVEFYRKRFFKHWYKLVTGHDILTDEHIRTIFYSLHPQDKPVIFKGPFICDQRFGSSCETVEPSRPIAVQKHACRILLLGGSRGVGTGARLRDDPYFVQIYQKLLTYQLKCDVMLYNFTDNRTDNFPEQVASGIIEQIQPHVIVLDYLYRTDEEVGYMLKVKKIAETNTKIFILDNYPSRYSRMLAKNGYKSIPIYEILNAAEMKGSGFIKWDQHHTTSYGHKLIAEAAVPYIFEALQLHPDYIKK